MLKKLILSKCHLDTSVSCIGFWKTKIASTETTQEATKIHNKHLNS